MSTRGRGQRSWGRWLAPVAVAAGAPALLLLAMELGPPCPFCEPILQMAYLWLATFVLLPLVLLLALLDRLRRTSWGLALVSLVVAVLLGIASVTET